ncbi:MAG: DUF6398 domain-containing protein [bacterium]
MKKKLDQKQEINEKKKQLIELTTRFCDEKLDEEYKNLSKKLIEKMSRKRQVSFLSGRIEIWAAAIIYAVGSVNFLFDKSTKPYVRGDEISSYFCTSSSTVSQKAKIIRDMFHIDRFSTEFLTETRMKSYEEIFKPFADLMMLEISEWRQNMGKIEEITENLNPLLDELIIEMKKQKMSCIKALNTKGYEVIIKKQNYKMPDFPPPKCSECGYQMDYNDWDEEECHTYFCPECGEPVEI